MFKRSVSALAIVFVFVLAMAGVASAQNSLNCDDFEFQEDAQAVYDQDPSDPNRLDGNDQDGFVCENLPSRGSAPASSGTTGGGAPSAVPTGGVQTGFGGAADSATGLPWTVLAIVAVGLGVAAIAKPVLRRS